MLITLSHCCSASVNDLEKDIAAAQNKINSHSPKDWILPKFCKKRYNEKP